MAFDNHLIGRVKFEVTIADVAMALALRERIELLGWQLMPRIFEQLFDALAPNDAHVQIARLQLDLGRVRPDHLEEDALAALRAALSDALSGAIARARQGDADDSRLMSDQAIRLERFGAFLASGIIPLTNHAEPFDASASLRRLIASDPVALAAMLRRRARDRYVLERLVLQADGEDLAMLLSALTPADAEVIRAMLHDIILVHRRTRRPALRMLSEPALTQLLWVTTFEFLLRDAGTQFNRRRFLAALIAREARQLGISYDALLELLSEAVQVSSARSRLQSSLPTALTELLAERRRAPSNDPMPADAADIAAGRPAFERVAETMAPSAFATLVRELEPSAAEAILGDLDALVALHARVPILPMGKAAFVRRLRALTLTCIAGRLSGQFDRRAMWRLILRELASAGRVGQAELAAALERRLRRSRRAAAVILQAMVSENRGGIAASTPSYGAAAGSGVPELEAVGRLIHLVQAGATATDLTAMTGALSGAEFTALLTHFDPQAAMLIADIDALLALHVQMPLLNIGRDALEALVRALLIVRLARSAGGRGRRVIGRAIIGELAIAARRNPSAFAAMLKGRLRARAGSSAQKISAGDPDGVPGRTEWRHHVEHFLRTGQPRTRGADLPELARSDPEWIADTIRRLARETPADIPRLVDRLLDWLIPQEIVAILTPQRAAEMLHAANRLSGGDRSYWQISIEALMRGEDPMRVMERAAPPGKHLAGEHLDRMFRLSSWLKRGWQAGSKEGETVDLTVTPADLLDLSGAELTDLLLTDDPEQTLARLSFATKALGREGGAALLARLAPWAANENGPLASVRASRETVMLRAAAAALAGTTIDMADLHRPVADPPEQTDASRAPSSASVVFTTAQLIAWLDGAPAGAADAAGMAQLFARLADADDPDLAAYLAAHRTRPRARARWAAILPRPALGRLVHLLAPTEARALLDGVMLLTVAWRQTASFGARRPSPEALWQILLDQIAEPRGVSVPTVLNRLVAGLAGDDTRQSGKIRERAQKLARDGGHVTVATALRRARPSVPRPAAAQSAPPATDRSTANANATSPEEPKHTLYVGNAGLVLLHPYLPTFFERLGLLAMGEDGRPHIPPGEPASRAVHLLQYLVDERLDRSEPELALNKLLCGQPIARPVARSIAPNQADFDLCDEMLRAVIANWPVLDNTSPAGLRETFLQREGRLQHGNAGWTLQVQRKTLDVLTDQVPWSFAVVYHRWMTDPIHVTW